MSQLLLPLAGTRRRPRVLCYGGGLDSFALLLEAIRRGERLDAVAFCDVADPLHEDPGEWPGTYQHLREVAIPLCERHGIPFHWIDTAAYPVRDARSLFAWNWARRSIPVVSKRHRLCTTIAKTERFERWLADQYPEGLVETWVGFEAGEEQRAQQDPNRGKSRRRVNRFPLMEWQLCRCRCEALVRAAGYPVPRKSACTMCPFGSMRDWQTLYRELPETFEKIAQLEDRRRATPTKKGIIMAIKGYGKVKDKATGKVLRIRSVGLREWVLGRPQKHTPHPCSVCGAPDRATKATGCGYLDPEPAQAA